MILMRKSVIIACSNLFAIYCCMDLFWTITTLKKAPFKRCPITPSLPSKGRGILSCQTAYRGAFL
jgi:hypothetical protein